MRVALCAALLPISPALAFFSRGVFRTKEGRTQHTRVASAVASDPIPSARASGLALLLDDGTRKSHSVAENTAFVTGFFRGIEKRENFANLVASLHFIYSSMEKAFEEVEDVGVRAMDYPELRRQRSLEADMDYYFGAAWKSGKVRPSRATKAYVARIQEVAADPEKQYLLIAHQYTRYLGDLFGGQMMGGMATRSLGLDPGKGIAFYDFPDIKDNKVFIEDWYAKLNALPLSEAKKAALVEEANRVFALNIGVFEELDGNPLAAVWNMAISALREKLGMSVA
mmetsp:Transcript_66841/g.150992  ORF Transcript_66841/g.150992 Transcript_66841/m.150992 type:complete len:283 (-) Transcript_66841:182-1030(-)